MKIIEKIIKRTVLFAVALAAALSCDKAEEKVDPVDLRFKTEDEYSLEALSPESISFIVRSMNGPWTVYSQNPGWCEIDPASGDKEEKYTVTVRYKDNNGLDDRVDTLVIQSSYWIGKWITVRQKGTAYLSAEENLNMDKGAGEISFGIESNQKWSAEVTSGEQWLSISGNASGELNGTVTVKALENKGEMRYGTVTIYDRHGKEAASVKATQNGVQLEPEISEMRVLYDETSAVLKIKSNTEWTVRKDSEKDDWYSFGTTQFNGDSELKINLQENKGTSMRKAVFIIETVSDGEAAPVRKSIVLKQACAPQSVFTWFKDGFGLYPRLNWATYPGSATIGDDGVTLNAAKGEVRLRRTDAPKGNYTLRFTSMSADASIFVCFAFAGGSSSQEVWWRLNAATGKTNNYMTEYSVSQTSFDRSEANELTMNMIPNEDGFYHLQYILNGTLVTDIPTTSRLSMSAVEKGDNVNVWIGANKGSAVLEFLSYTDPVIPWDEEE